MKLDSEFWKKVMKDISEQDADPVFIWGSDQRTERCRTKSLDVGLRRRETRSRRDLAESTNRTRFPLFVGKLR